MVRNSVFWKRIYLVVILLSCNCFLVCSNSFCESVKKIFGCESQEEEENNLEINNKTNNINNLNLEGNDSQYNTFNNNSLHKEKKNSNPNDNENSNHNDFKNQFKDVDFSKLKISKKTGLLTDRPITLKTLFCSAPNHRVGKTSIMQVAKGLIFNEQEASTIISDFHSFYLQTDDNRSRKIQCWELSSLNKNQNSLQLYYKNKDAFVFVYDISKKESLEDLAKFIKEHILQNISPDTLLFLLGNKLDLVEQNQNKNQRQVSTEEAKQFAGDNNLIFLGECSAKENTYVPVAGNTCYKKESLQDGKCTDGVVGILKDIAYNLYKHDMQPMIQVP